MNSKKILLVGGTGTISTAVMQKLSENADNQVVVLNRGSKEVPSYVRQSVCDVNEEGALARAIGDEKFDAVVDFLVYDAAAAKQRMEVFADKCSQYFFISTVVTFDHEDKVWLNENSVQGNKYSRYGKNKWEAEEAFRANDSFPWVIVRPSQTYSGNRIPLSVKGNSCWSVVNRIANHKSVIVHGDGKSIWHMMHARDFAYNFVQMIGNPAAVHQSVNLVNPAIVTWDMIYNEIGRQLGTEVRFCHIASDTLACAGKYNNIEVLLGDKQYSNMYAKKNLTDLIPDFRCEIGLKEGIEMYLSYMEAHPEEKVEDLEYDAWCDSVIRDYHAFMKIFSERH